MEAISLLGSTMGLAFFAGLRLYATVLTVGMGIRFGWFVLPSELSALSIMAHPLILTVAGIIFIVEFLADKIPWVDSLWDAIHTIIRPLGAAVIGTTALGSIDPLLQTTAFLLYGGLGFSSHSTKAGTRLLINHSPEPASNVGASLFEDFFVISGTWLSITNPKFVLFFVILFLFFFLLLAPKFFRLLRIELLAFKALFRANFGSKTHPREINLFENLPDKFLSKMPENIKSDENNFCIRCVSGKGTQVGRNYIGYLCLVDHEFFFITKKRFRIKRFEMNVNQIEDVKLEKKLLLPRLSFRLKNKRIYWYLFKDTFKKGEKIMEILDSLPQQKVMQK